MSTATTARVLGCPQCGSAEVETIEQIIGLCRSTISRNADGTIDVEGHGETDVAWDTTESIGVQCRSCLWGYEGPDWAQQLVAALPADLDAIVTASAADLSVAADRVRALKTAADLDDLIARSRTEARPVGADQATTAATGRRRVQVKYVRRHAARAIADRIKTDASSAIISCHPDPDRLGSVILHVNSSGNAIASETALRAAGYRVEWTGYDPFAPGHYGCQIRIIPVQVEVQPATTGQATTRN